MPVIVFCPMEIERKAVARELRGAGLPDTRVVQTGIGKDAIVRAAKAEFDRAAPGTLFVLAGACGGLSHTTDVPPIARVIDEHGAQWTPRTADPRGVTLIAVDHVVATPRDKRALAERTGAAIVDMETHAFAAACEAAGVPWTVVRGVSDTPDETLPAEVINWVRPDGGTYAARAAIGLLTKPSLVPHIIGVVRRANRVLPQVGRRGAAIAQEWGGSPAAPASTPPHTAPVTPLPLPTAVPLVIFFGGTFDPPHTAHIDLPQQVRAQVESRDHLGSNAWLVYVPAARSPHKTDIPAATDAQRLDMLRLALAGVERATVWTDELDRAVAPDQPSYTVDTLARARDWLNRTGSTHTRLRLLIGADQAAAFHRWREPRRIIELAEPIVMGRGDGDTSADTILQSLRATGFWSDAELEQWRGRIIPIVPNPASATAIRRALADGRPADAAAMLPPAVLGYITSHRLYAAAAAQQA